MNYFTKRWYELCQKSRIYFPLEEAKEAESFSEEYFQKLYNQKLANWLTLKEEVASYREEFESAKENYVPEPFDKEKSVKNVAKEYQQYYKKASESFDKNIVKNKNFHDCMIIIIQQTDLIALFLSIENA